MENDLFWPEIGSGFGEPGGTPPPRIRRSMPPPGSDRRSRSQIAIFVRFDLCSHYLVSLVNIPLVFSLLAMFFFFYFKIIKQTHGHNYKKKTITTW